MAFSTPKVLHSHVQLTHLSVNIFPKTLSKNQPSTTNSGKTIDMTVGTENASKSEKLLIKENENSDGNIKTLDEVVMPMDLTMQKDLKSHDQQTNSSANVSVSKKPIMDLSMSIDQTQRDEVRYYYNNHSNESHSISIYNGQPNLYPRLEKRPKLLK